MKISVWKSFKKRHRTLNAVLIKNPALVLGFDLPFLIATSTSVKNALVMSIEMMFIHIITMAISVIFARKLPLWLRSLITVIISAGVMMLIRELIRWIFPDVARALAMYIYLLAVNGLTLFQSLGLTRRSRLVPVLRKEFFHVTAFVFTMFILSILREYFGNGTLWGIAIPMPFKLSGLSGIAMPFSGFILMGFLMAFIKFANRNLIGFAIMESDRRRRRFAVNPK